MQVQSQLINYQQVFNILNGLSDLEKDRAIKAGLRDATNIFIRSGKANLIQRNKGTSTKGNLKSSFKNRVKKRMLGALAGFNDFGHHAHLLDRGTSERFTRSGARRGKVVANHFWNDAIVSNQTQAINTVYLGIEKAINKIMTRN